MTYSLSENSVTQGLHASLGGNFILIQNLFGVLLLKAVMVTLIYAAIKEFWWDIHFESKETSGGWIGSSRDFGFYLIGAALALGILFVRSKVSI